MIKNKITTKSCNLYLKTPGSCSKMTELFVSELRVIKSKKKMDPFLRRDDDIIGA